MVAVAQASPAQLRPLVVVRTTPVARPLPVRATAATYRRRRLVAAALIATTVVALFIALSALTAPVGGSPASRTGTDAPLAAGTVHVVQPGDTFWGIAQSLRPNEDPRPLVDRLVAAHGSRSLLVGERITLPAGS